MHRDCLTPQQTNFEYKKVELGSLINKNTIKEELDTEIELDRMDDNSGDESPYKELIVNNAGKNRKCINTIWSNGQSLATSYIMCNTAKIPKIFTL